jgi:hypothetical protein
MFQYGTVTHTSVGALDYEGHRYQVTLYTSHDGIEFVGRLWFADDAVPESDGIPDRAVLPGRTEAEVQALAHRLTPDELRQRFRRATAEKRRFHGLRALTMELLDKIRYLNQVGVSMRSGLLDADAAAQELELTEQQMVALVRQAKRLAGVET